jgi:radical SAM superfamily enzyme YgiQ (UPF0313 family)
MKVLLANSPWLDKKVGSKAGARWGGKDNAIGSKSIFIPFPFFLAYASALLKEHGEETMLVDCVANGERIGGFLKRISDFSPDMILIESSTPSICNDIEITKRIKEISKARIILTGTHMFSFGNEVLKNNPSVDYVMFGEYEFTLLSLVKSLESGKDLRDVNGLIYRKGNETVRNRQRIPIKDLDAFPFPDWESLPMKEYYGIGMLPIPQAQIWASRGCPYRCIFCVYPPAMYYNTYRIRNPERVVDEIERLIEHYGFRNFYFFDDNFPAVRWWVDGFTSELKKRNIKIRWAAQMRGDNVDRKTLRMMKDSGFVGGLIGVESGCEDIQRNIDKNLDLAKIRQTMKWFHELGLKAHLTFTFGLPRETRETIRKTLEFAKELDPYSAQFSVTIPLPGTKYFDYARKRGFLVTKEWEKYDGRHNAVIMTEFLNPREILSEKENVVREWNRFNMLRRVSSNKYHYLKQGIKNPCRIFYFLKTVLDSYGGS